MPDEAIREDAPRADRLPSAWRATASSCAACLRDDAPAYVAAFRDDPELGRLLGMEEDPDEARIRQRAKRMPALAAEGRIVELAIGESFAGSVILHSFDEHHRRCEVGFWLVSEARGRGLGSRAVALGVGWAFRELDLLRVEMTTTPDNAAVLALARRLGFTQEGVLRQAQRRARPARRRRLVRRAARRMAVSAYGQLLRLPGVARMAGSALVLGIAGTMAPVSFVLFAHRATGSFATASLVLAASTAGGLLAAPFRGRLIDRIGPSAAILRLALPVGGHRRRLHPGRPRPRRRAGARRRRVRRRRDHRPVDRGRAQRVVRAAGRQRAAAGRLRADRRCCRRSPSWPARWWPAA